MISCKIVSAQSNKAFEDLDSVTLPAKDGEMEVLPGHAEAFIKLSTGEVILIKSNREKISVPVLQAVCFVKDDSVVIIE